MTLPRTPSQTVGPFFAIGLARRAQNKLNADGLRLHGTVLDGDEMPIDDAVVEIWDGARWGRCGTDAEGRFWFSVTKPAGREGEAPRFDVHVFARGLLKHQLTRIYFLDEEQANAADPVLSSLDADDRATLIAGPEDGALRFDIRMQGDRQTVFFAV